MNHAIIVLVLMVLGHLLADYPLQGWLAQAKQKSYWSNFEEKYKRDWIPALLCHAVMWGVLVCLPMAVTLDLRVEYMLGWMWLAIPINVAVHFVIDDLKANRKKINLWQDQLLHLIQIAITWLVWYLTIWR